MADEPTPKEPTPAAKADDLATVITDLLKSHKGDASAVIGSVMAERDKYREELAATKGKLPKDGAVVLDADTAKVFAAYQALGEPAALAKQLEAGATATAERDDLKFKSHIGDVATLARMRPAVLADRVKASGVEIVVKEEADPKAPTGAKLRVPHVKGEGDKTTPLAEYAATNWGDYLPALSAEPAPPPAPRGSPPTTGSGPPRPAVVERSGRPLQPLVR